VPGNALLDHACRGRSASLLLPLRLRGSCATQTPEN